MLNLLRENNNCENYSLNKITVKPQSFEECLLELNDSIHEAYIDDYIDGLKSNMINRVIYKSILEDASNENASATTKKKENIFRRIYNAFKKWITSIINYFKGIFNIYKQIDNAMEEMAEEIFKAYAVDLYNCTVNDTNTSDINNGIGVDFKKAVDAQKVLRVRIMLKDQILLNANPKGSRLSLDDMINYALSNLKTPLFVKYDADPPISTTKDDWNVDYFNINCVRLVNNFSKERFNHLVDVATFLYKDGQFNESAVENIGENTSIKTFFSDTREFTLFFFPSAKDLTPSVYDFLTQSIDRIILPKIRNNSGTKTRDEIISEIEKDILSGLYNQLPKNSNSSKFTSIEDYKKYISEACTRKTVTCTGLEYMKNHNANRDNSIASNSATYSKKLNDLNKSLDKMLSSFANSDDKDKDALIISLTFLSDIAKLTSQLINNSIKSYIDMGKYFLKVFAPYTKSSKNEAGFIHGEPFDGDTLFANGDPRDFNPTEWMNLELTTEMYEIRYAIRECRKNIAIKEANIILNSVDPKRTINELVSMREAEEKKFNLNIDTIILRISEMINKFLGFVKDRFNQDSMLLKKNAEKMKEPFKFEKVSSKGDILAGIDRVQTHFDIRYDESTMKDDTKKDIFEKQVLPKLNDGTGKRKLSWAPDKMEISEYCKLYFGAPMSDSAEGFTLCEYTGTELNGAKDKITGFIHNFNRITASINNDLNSLKVESKKLGVKTNAPNAATQQQTSTTTSSTVEPQNNSACYYSILYDRYINEADIVKVETDSNRNDNTNDDNKPATNGPNEYFNCYKDVIAAKLTAIEFIHSELMQIIRNHLGIKPTPAKGKEDNNK